MCGLNDISNTDFTNGIVNTDLHVYAVFEDNENADYTIKAQPCLLDGNNRPIVGKI